MSPMALINEGKTFLLLLGALTLVLLGVVFTVDFVTRATLPGGPEEFIVTTGDSQADYAPLAGSRPRLAPPAER